MQVEVNVAWSYSMHDLVFSTHSQLIAHIRNTSWQVGGRSSRTAINDQKVMSLKCAPQPPPLDARKAVVYHDIALGSVAIRSSKESV